MKCDPHVLCLQEVTEDLLDIIMHSQLMQRRFLTSGPLRHSYDVVMLVRRDLAVHWWTLPLPTLQGRRCLIADIITPHQVSVRVATVHLESTKECARTRGKQLTAILPQIATAPMESAQVPSSVLLCGDFNFCSTWAENDRIVGSGFVDLWPQLHGMDPGFTEDTARNEMLMEAKWKVKQVRFDRILLRALCAVTRDSPGFVKASAIQLLGVEPFASGLWPSDHFGLFAEVQLSGDE